MTDLERLALNTLEDVREYMTAGPIWKGRFMEIMTEIRDTLDALKGLNSTKNGASRMGKG